jgi:hypothetical protein
VYSRLPFVPDDRVRARLDAAVVAGLASVISSSDAVDALVRMVDGQPPVLRALRSGPALASHPRIAEKLRAAGFGGAMLCVPEAAAVLAALRGGGG